MAANGQLGPFCSSKSHTGSAGRAVGGDRSSIRPDLARDLQAHQGARERGDGRFGRFDHYVQNIQKSNNKEE